MLARRIKHLLALLSSWRLWGIISCGGLYCFMFYLGALEVGWQSDNYSLQLLNIVAVQLALAGINWREWQTRIWIFLFGFIRLFA